MIWRSRRPNRRCFSSLMALLKIKPRRSESPTFDANVLAHANTLAEDVKGLNMYFFRRSNRPVVMRLPPQSRGWRELGPTPVQLSVLPSEFDHLTPQSRGWRELGPTPVQLSVLPSEFDHLVVVLVSTRNPLNIG